MKNILGFLTIALIAITFVSCEKDYTCTCTSVDSSGLLEDVVTTSDITGKKGDAEDECSAKATALTIATVTTTCELD